MTRFSDGTKYKGYAISDDGARIILPALAVEERELILQVTAAGYCGDEVLAKWREAIEKDLNIPNLWVDYLPHGDDNHRDGKLRVLARKGPRPAWQSDEFMRRVVRAIDVIMETQERVFPSFMRGLAIQLARGEPRAVFDVYEEDIRTASSISRQAIQAVRLLDAIGHK